MRRFYDYARIDCRELGRELSGDLETTRGFCDIDVATDGGRMTTVRLYVALTWACRGGTWQLTLRQATRLPRTLH